MTDEPLKGSNGYQKNSIKDENNYSVKKYLQTAHVHGLKYLSGNRKSEVLLWTLVITISVGLTATLLSCLIFSSSDVNIKISPPRPVSDLPFPAITICSVTKAQKSIVNFTDAYHFFHNSSSSDFDVNDTAKIEALSQICDPHLFEDLQLSDNPTPGADFEKILREISVDDFMLFCKFRGELTACEKIFNETITENGLCQTFNLNNFADQAEWSRAGGFESQNYESTPRRAFAGTDVGVVAVLGSKTTDLDFICRGPVQGYTAKIHAPDEHPQMTSGYFMIPLQSEVLVEVKVGKSGNTKPCDSGKSLKYFENFNQANCFAECLSDFVLSKCGCTKFSMAHDKSTPICNQHQTKCVADASLEFSTTRRFEENFPCDCKPDCDVLSYETRITEAVFDFKRVFTAYKESQEEFPETIMGRLSVFVKNDFYTETKTDGNSFAEWIAKIGGILAFFLGVSCISVVEVLFFVFKRLGARK